MPLDKATLPYEVQEAWLIHDLLPTRWDGMSGSYLGKDWSSLALLLDEFCVDNRQQCIVFMKNIEARDMEQINRELQQKRKSSSNTGGKLTNLSKKR